MVSGVIVVASVGYLASLLCPWERSEDGATSLGWDGFISALSGTAALGLILWELLQLRGRATAVGTLETAAMAGGSAGLGGIALGGRLLRDYGYETWHLAWGYWISVGFVAVLATIALVRLHRPLVGATTTPGLERSGRSVSFLTALIALGYLASLFSPWQRSESEYGPPLMGSTVIGWQMPPGGLSGVAALGLLMWEVGHLAGAVTMGRPTVFVRGVAAASAATLGGIALLHRAIASDPILAWAITWGYWVSAAFVVALTATAWLALRGGSRRRVNP